MYQCSQCGTEFEGNFCPNCGAKKQVITACPACGAKVAPGAKFCGECGQKLTATPAAPAPAPVHAQSQPSPAPVQQEIAAAQAPAAVTAQPYTAATAQQGGISKIYNLLFFLPCVLFSVFSVLLFLFFVGDYASVTMSFLGETFSESTGSLYELLGESEMLEMSGYGGVVYTLLALAAISLIFAIVFLTMTVSKTKRGKTLAIGGKTLYRTTLLAYVSFVLYFVLFLVSCIGAGQVGGDEMDAGAPLICTLVFSLIFGLLGGGAIVTRFLLAKKNPDLATAEASEMQAYAEAAQLSKAAPAAVAGTEGATYAASTDEQKIKTVKDIKRLVRRRRASSLFAFSILMPLVGFIGMFTALCRQIWDWNPAQLEHERKSLVSRIVLNTIFGIIAAGYSIFFLVYMMPMMFEHGGAPIWVESLMYSVCAYWFLAAGMHVVGIFLAASAFPACGRLGVAFYGKAQPNCLIDQQILSMKELNEFQTTEESAGKRHRFFDAILIPAVCVVLAGVIAVGSWVSSLFLGNSFPANAAKRIELGAYYYNVRDSLGDPDVPMNEDDYENASRFIYYGGEIKSLMDESLELEKEMEKIMEDLLSGKGNMSDLEKKAEELEKKALELEKKAEKIESYQEIVVYFSTYGSNSSRYVSEVSIDMNVKPNSTDDNYKTVQDVTLNKTSLSASELESALDDTNYGSSRLSAKINYTDGSYRNVYVPISAIMSMEPVSSGSNSYKITWTDGYDSWISPDDEYSATIKVSDPVSLNCTVSFELNGGYIYGSDHYDSITCEAGDYISLPTPTKSGYAFEGWYTDRNFSSSSKASTRFYPERSCTLYAHWTEISYYTVSFETNGGYYDGTRYPSSQTVASNDSIRLSTPTKEGYTFGGWYTRSNFSSSSKVTDNYFHPEESCTLYAEWFIKVSFDLNGGKYGGYGYIEDMTCHDDFSIDLPTPTKSGYIFEGWYKDYSFSNKITNNYFFPEKNCTLYARWAVSVNFELNGGYYNGSGNINEMLCPEGDYINLPTPMKSDYLFEGWYTNPSFSGNRANTRYYATSSVTLYARWTYGAVPAAPYTLQTDLTDYSSSDILKPSNVSLSNLYTFTQSGSSYISNNKGQDGTTALMAITANRASEISFSWSVSSESNYDKIYIWVVDTDGSINTLVDGSSGSTGGTVDRTLNQNQTIYIAYAKDSSQSSNNDQVVIENLQAS